MKESHNHLLAVFQAVLVTFLWSTSFILIKWGLRDIPALSFAGLRYGIATICFLPFIFREKHRKELAALTRGQWTRLIFLGVVFYTFTQGAQFWGLSLLPSVTVSLLLNFTPVVVALLGIGFLKEKPNLKQWGGAFLFICGVVVYFLPMHHDFRQFTGVTVMLFGVLANAAAAIMGRSVNRQRSLSPIVVTFVSMGVGAVILLAAGFCLSGFPVISGVNWLILLWLATINTAAAFTLWNVTLRSLSAMESSILNGTMLIQIGVLAWVFLDESIGLLQGVGMGIAFAGAVLVQIRESKK